MKYSLKQKLFKDFLFQWSKEFNEVHNIVKYISSYFKLAHKFAFYSINDTPERINNSQLEWVSLVSQFDHPLEKEFFKSYWVPLESDGYGLFLDLSSGTFTLFEMQYFFFEPYQWTKKIWFEDMNDFLLWATDDTIEIDEQIEENKRIWESEFHNLFFKRNELGYAGKIDNDKINQDDIIAEEMEVEIHSSNNTITILGINSIIVGLLSADIKISLTQFDLDEDFELNPKIKNIKSFVYLLQSWGYLSVYDYYFHFHPENIGYVKYEDNVFTISHQDKTIIRNFLKKFELLNN